MQSENNSDRGVVTDNHPECRNPNELLLNKNLIGFEEVSGKNSKKRSLHPVNKLSYLESRFPSDED